MSEFIQHEPCSKCGSRDNLARYDDGHGYCFGCSHYEKSTKETCDENWLQTEYHPLPKRGLTLETCQRWEYGIAKVQGKLAHVANYRTAKGKLVGQKLRFQDKSFQYKGTTPAPFYGMHLWSGGKKVVVTEGEIDALSLSQLQHHKWPVVSLPTGATGAYSSIKKHLEWFDQFETVVLLFDKDEVGQKAAQKCAELFKPGHVKIATLPLKDVNDMLLAERGNEVIQAIWNAAPFRPEGVIEGIETWPLLEKDPEQKQVSLLYPYQALNVKTKGLRKGEIVTFCAGTGIGKSQTCRELAYHLIQQGEKIGYIGLEESVTKSVKALLGLALNRPLHDSTVSLPELKAAWERLAPYMVFYDHFGSMAIEPLLNRIRYMVVGLDCSFIILDHNANYG